MPADRHARLAGLIPGGLSDVSKVALRRSGRSVLRLGRALK